MRKIWERILAAATVLFGKRIIIIDAKLEKKRNRMAVRLRTTIKSKDDQIVYLDQMTKTLQYERQEELQKDRTFQAANN